MAVSWTRVVALAWVVYGVPSMASASPPSAFASQYSDGRIHMVIVPDRAWQAAELVIAGGDTLDLGPAEKGTAVEVAAWAENRTAHSVVLRTAELDGAGVTCRFEVDTQLVPDPPKQYLRSSPREWKKWWFGPKPPERDPQP